MANGYKKTANGKEYLFLDSTGSVALREAFPGAVSSFLITVEEVGSPTYAVTPQGVAAGYGLAASAAHDIGYEKLSESDPPVAAGSAIAAEDNYLIRGDGMDVFLTVDSISGGELNVYVSPLLG